MFDLGGGELLLILVAVLVLFGPKKLPELAQGLGKGLRQFKQAQQDFTDQINSAFADEQRKENAAKARPGAENTIARPASGTVSRSNSPQPSVDRGEQEGTAGEDAKSNAPEKSASSESPESSTPVSGDTERSAKETKE